MNSTNKYLLTLFCLLFFTLNIQSQNTAIDSLKNKVLLHTQKDTIRVKLLNDIAFLYYKKDIAKAIAYIRESETLTEAIGFKKGKGKSLYIKGIIQTAQSNFDQAINLYETIDFKIGISECYNGMGITAYYKSDYKQSIAYHKKAVGVDILIMKKGLLLV